MLISLLPLALTGLLQVPAALAQSAPPSCSLDKKCPEEAPCCSQYNQCGVGAFCLGGCDPRMSFSLDSCVPAPVCESKTYPMNSMDRIVNMNKYLGDASKADWVYQGEPALHNGGVILTMPPRSVGTVMASTTYMWYGSVKARMKTSRGRGVVSAFILYSDVKDEIDYEFVGVDLETAQTNYYFQGIPNYTQGGNISLSDTYSNWHEYEIEWTPDEIKWIIDGQVGRTKKRKDTFNETSNQYDYPQTPSRVQLSIWPGGLETNAKGTIDWAGGVIDWDSDEIKKNKYYFATFGEITVKCWDADKPPGSNKRTSYIYNDIKGTEDTVEDTDRPTVLKSFSGTGMDMDKEAPKDPNDEVHSLPGGGSPQGSGGAGGHGSGGGGEGSGGSPAEGCDGGGFSQNCRAGAAGDEKNEGAGLRGTGSALAVIVAVAAMLWM